MPHIVKVLGLKRSLYLVIPRGLARELNIVRRSYLQVERGHGRSIIARPVEPVTDDPVYRAERPPR